MGIVGWLLGDTRDCIGGHYTGDRVPRSRREPMPGPFEALAQYNSERARGLLHTPEWDERMAALQAEFDRWAGNFRLDGFRLDG
jgi:hypothetical protein